ncbi:MAG TPA: TonB-dependent receptor [Gemmatimonadales bacterium]|nr:TonB-dependent receptor [Gemmatimonadales bacterium]
MRCVAVAAMCCGMLPRIASAQQRDTTPPHDSLTVFTLPPAVVSVTRTNPPMSKVPLAVQLVGKQEISRARQTLGLDEALFTVPGLFIANRYNFSLDQRLSIRGFGSRSAFAVRGVKVLLDGIPQTLPDGQGQLTNLELGAADRIEVLRGSSSALFGNASGGVISIWTDPVAPKRSVAGDVRIVAGSFDRDLGRTWTKWQMSPRIRVGRGSLLLTASRLVYEGERDHSDADFRNYNGRLHLPLSPRTSLAVIANYGDQPVADNPGALTWDELRANRDSAPAINLSSAAGKDVEQFQGGVTLRRQFSRGGEAAATAFYFARDLKNPTTFAYIDLNRRAYGARFTVTQPVSLGSLPHRLTAGLDYQGQRDDRVNFGNTGGSPDPGVRTLDQLERVTEIGPFVQSAVELSPRATVTGGLRYDRVSFRAEDRLVTSTNPDDSGERVMDAVSGSLGVAVTPGDRVTVYANVGTSFETPTTTELTNRPTGAGGFNLDLEPQKATNYEVGVRGNLDGRLGYSVAVFQADVRDALISFEVQDPTFPGRRFFRNAGSSRHRGIELGADLQVVPGLTAQVSWNYSDFVYTDYRVVTSTRTFILDGNALPGIPEHWLRLGVRARPAFARGAWADVDLTYASSVLLDDTLDTSGPAGPVASRCDRVRCRAWEIVNVRVGWEGVVGRLRLSPFVALNNVFNQHYVGSVVINAARGRYYEPAPGRNMYVGLSLGAGQ